MAIAVEESDTNIEHLVKGEALVCVSKDGSIMMVRILRGIHKLH